MDWTFLVLSWVVIGIAVLVARTTTWTRYLTVDMTVRAVIVSLCAGFIAFSGQPWLAYQLCIAFLLGSSVWVILHRKDD